MSAEKVAVREAALSCLIAVILALVLTGLTALTTTLGLRLFFYNNLLKNFLFKRKILPPDGNLRGNAIR